MYVEVASSVEPFDRQPPPTVLVQPIHESFRPDGPVAVDGGGSCRASSCEDSLVGFDDLLGSDGSDDGSIGEDDQIRQATEAVCVGRKSTAVGVPPEARHES